MGLKRDQTTAAEREDLDDDRALVRSVEVLTLTYDWERKALEEASQRVYDARRSLLPRQRDSLERILGRRGAASE